MGETEAFYYRPVPDGAVSIDRRHEAERALRLAREMLPEIPAEAKITWVTPVSPASGKTDELLAQIENKLRELMPTRERAWISPADPAFKKSKEGPFWGMVGTFSKGSIKISTAVPFDQIAFVIGHEAKHAADSETHCLPLRLGNRKNWEARADEFGRKVEARARRNE